MVTIGLLIGAAAPLAEEERLPAPLVYLSAIDATIEQDIRYATAANFTGRIVPGNEAGECILAAEAARALARVQRDLQPRGLALKVYDCYRPRRAVAALVAWAGARADETDGKRFHPRLTRPQLLAQGYIARQSEHSRGLALDLTLVAIGTPKSHAAGEVVLHGNCNAPRSGRSHDGSVDMGTDFDCFDRASHTRAPGLTPAQRTARRMLVEAMERHGFAPYSREWWHFHFTAGTRGPSFEVPVRSRPRPAGEPRR